MQCDEDLGRVPPSTDRRYRATWCHRRRPAQLMLDIAGPDDTTQSVHGKLLHLTIHGS